MNSRTKPSKTYRGGVAGGADGRLEGAVELTASQLRELLRAIDADAAWRGPTIPQEFDHLAAKIWEQQGMPAPCGPLTMIVHERRPVVLARRQPNDAAQAEAAPAAESRGAACRAGRRLICADANLFAKHMVAMRSRLMHTTSAARAAPSAPRTDSVARCAGLTLTAATSASQKRTAGSASSCAGGIALYTAGSAGAMRAPTQT